MSNFRRLVEDILNEADELNSFLIQDLVEQIRQRLKLGRDVEISFDENTARELVSEKEHNLFRGIVYIDGKQYTIKCHKKEGRMALDYIFSPEDIENEF